MKRKPRVEGAHYERNYVYNFHFHLIWVTKYRQKAFTTPELVDEMKDILMHIASLNDVEIETMEVMPDHIHMLISFKPKYAPTDIVKALKGGSARLFFKAPRNKEIQVLGWALWSYSYFMSTLVSMSKDVVRKIYPESVF